MGWWGKSGKRRRWLGAAVLAAICLLVAAGEAVTAQAPLVVYGDANFPPYESLVDGQPVGANIDLWRAIGRVLDRDIDIRLGPWAESQDKVAHGTGDALSFLNVTEGRQALYDFTQPTFTFRFPIFTRVDDVARFNIKDMSGMRIAVKRGGFPASILERSHPEATPMPVDNVVDGFRMLLRGEVNGVIESELVGYDLLHRNGFAGIRATTGVLALQTAHIAVPKGHRELLQELSRAITTLVNNGELDRIADRWAGENFIFWERRAFQQVAIEGGAALAVLLGGLGFFYVLRTRRSNRLLREEIAKRKATEAELTATQGTLHAVMDHAVDGLITLDESGTIRSFSKPAERIFGYTDAEVIGHNIAELMTVVDGAEFGRHLNAHLAAAAGLAEIFGAGREMQGRRKDGNEFPMDVAVCEIPGSDRRWFVGTIRDITESKLAQIRVHQAQKMEAIGQLASGIAHDFNNILGAVTGFAGFLTEDLPQGTQQHSFAQRIVKATGRATELVRQILAFSRRTNVDREALDLAVLLRETRELLRGSLPSMTEIDVKMDQGGIVASVNAGQFSQILLNLCVNANDALAGRPGKISIELTQVNSGDADYARFESGVLVHETQLYPAEGRVFAGALDAERSYARLTIADTGVGMGPDVLGRIFDPFFTTKERGSGTGLGLSVVHGIVLSYDGACTVASRPGAGSVFTIYLPVSKGMVKAAAAPSSQTRGRERVLIVDDEVDLSDSLSIGLKRLGYTVTAINDPRTALEIFAGDPGVWDIVVSDHLMPHMTGKILFAELKVLRPSLRFILSSGFGDGSSEKTALSVGMDAFLLKPVSAEQLAACIRRVLDHPPGERAPSHANAP
jgi:PAS domain S-box-containing protein